MYWGGRGSAKSWSVSRALIALAHTKKVRIGCFREFQNTIKDSVLQLLNDQINEMGLQRWFSVTQSSIISLATGSTFIFKGLHNNVTEIKSTEGLDIVWVEEAQLVSKDSWEILIPTVRKGGSEIWVTFNPVLETDATYDRLITHKPPNSIVKKVNWRDNPFFTDEMELERQYMYNKDKDAYMHIWEGECYTISEAVIFRGLCEIEPFETPDDVRWFHGLDHGFANDPAVLGRCFITGKVPFEHLWVDQMEYGYSVEIDELPVLFDKVQSARRWPIKADPSRPETISYLSKRGFAVSAAEKWKGSVEDGIAHLKGFVKIHIHPRCKQFIPETYMYRYKVDRVTKEVLPVIIDKHNHGWDTLRYALDKYIRRRGGLGVWAKLGQS